VAEHFHFEPKLAFERTHPPCSREDIVDLESKIGFPLPDDYRAFLEEWNGGFFRELASFLLQDCLDEDDPCDWGDVTEMFGLYDATDGFDLRQASGGYGFREDVPAEYIVIGHAFRWPQVCISIAGDDRGQVYYWDPGEPWPARTATPRGRAGLRPVAPSFVRFWDQLVERQRWE
jgi:hypothetical protein